MPAQVSAVNLCMCRIAYPDKPIAGVWPKIMGYFTRRFTGARATDIFSRRSMLYMSQWPWYEPRQKTLEQHQMLVAAIEKQDAKGTEEIARVHVRDVGKIRLANLIERGQICRLRSKRCMGHRLSLSTCRSQRQRFSRLGMTCVHCTVVDVHPTAFSH